MRYLAHTRLQIGGILPGSMPPSSTTIFDEGARIESFKIIERGEYNRDGLLRHLIDEPAKYNSGTRCLRDVESDLMAQVSALMPVLFKVATLAYDQWPKSGVVMI